MDSCSLRQDDPDLVGREYADESRFLVRRALWARRSGPQPLDVALAELVAARPRAVLEVGCGTGEFAAAVATAAGVERVVAVDRSERMVGLTRARGVDARVGDARALPFADADFDAAAANFVLYHVPEVDRALAELARVLRPGGRLVAAANGVRQLAELWELVGRDVSDRWSLFMRETGEELLRRHFAAVRVVDLQGTVDLTAAEMREYVAVSVAHRHLAAAVPDFAGTRPVTTSSAVFVADRA